MDKVLKFLKDVETYYLATVEGDQPRVRLFGTAHVFEGKLYIQTGTSCPGRTGCPRWRRFPGQTRR